MIGFNPLTGEITIQVDQDLTISQLKDICQMMQMQLDEITEKDNSAKDMAE